MSVADPLTNEASRYRYALQRDCAVPWATKRILWVMLNPSTADEKLDDPTIRKCRGFTTRWGFAGFSVVNLFAFRATKPRTMWLARYRGEDIIGPENDESILAADRVADMVVVAWGRVPREAFERRDAVLKLLDNRRELYTLGQNGDGSPSHPLMAPYAAPLVWRHKEEA